MAPHPRQVHMNETSENELQRALGRLESAVTALTKEVRDSNALHTAHDASIDRRVAKLETRQVYVTAFGAGITTAIGIIGTILWRVLSLPVR